MQQCLSQNMQEIIARSQAGPTPGQRKFVEDLWGVPVQTQLALEHYFDRQYDLHEIDHPLAIDLVLTAQPFWGWSADLLTEKCSAGYPW